MTSGTVKKTALRPIKEKEFMGQVIQLARLLKWRTYHTFNSQRSSKGFPDLVFVRKKVVYAELKKQDGKLSIEQAEWIADLKNAGQEVYVWRPSDWDEIEAVLS